MPFLHGFRRIIYEYQPLVDAVMSAVELGEGHDNPANRLCSPEEESRVCASLVALLERESHSEVFNEGISYALFKMAEQGLIYAADILLRYGAGLNFEDPVSYYNPLHISVLRNKPNMVKLLVAHGADIEKRDRIHESSPLDLASEESERLSCLLTLLDLGADVNANDKYGKTPLLHALASSDGLTVHNTENIKLLLQRGADVKACTVDGESVESAVVFLIKEAMDASVEDAAEIGNFCLKTTELLLTHGVDPSLNEEGDASLTQTSLDFFDLLFPLAALILQSGASLRCTHHGDTCWSVYTSIFERLHKVLQHCSDLTRVSELIEQAEVLLTLARVNAPILNLSPEIPVHVQDSHPHGQALADLHRRVKEQESSPPALRCICRAFIRGHLKPWPLEAKVKALPLPDRLKDFILPEQKCTLREGWDSFKPEHNQE
ncbi:ankyrin repeat and SOCS box protein 6 [Eucyclogobius newberryi]|uniref:ankyrin repeat and SOCS box protein 6 n=1 Tax=Eucyclogobius newberryi TaxID=166745 RepID=UPI003B5BA9A1